MSTYTINILPENFKPLPVVFNTASTYYNQHTMEYYKNRQNFYQILIILEGKGTLYYNNEEYKLEKGCAFFTSKNVVSKYVNEGNLVSAFLTVKGDGMPQLIEHFGGKEFLFYKHIKIEKFVPLIKQIIDEYYETKNESTISALSYAFFIKFFNQQNSTYLASLDKTALYIEKNFAKKLTLYELAEINDTSVSKLCHDFKDKYKCTVFQHIINLRLQYAHNLINTSAYTKTKDVAKACGFDDVSYFCRIYKKKFGTTPSSKMR